MKDTPAQIIIVDNNEDHLRAIVDTFHNSGVGCLGIRFDPQSGLSASHFRAVRFLFLDLHLLSTATYGGREHYAHLAQILSDNISPDGGPFALILWTSFDDQVDGLIQYLDSTRELPPHARPVAVARLAKDLFLNEDERGVNDRQALMREIDKALAMAPQLAALFSWERDVQTAIRSTLASVIGLVPIDRRTSQAFPIAVDVALSRLAIAAVGTENVSKDPRAALNASLAPILADRTSSQRVAPDSGLWRSAITHTQVPALASADSSLVNRMLHIALPQAESILATDWGAVVDLPLDWTDDNALRLQFGLTGSELLIDHFKIKADFHNRCSAKLVRIGAPCDYAQQRSGPITYLLALRVPETVPGGGKRSDAIWRSPPLSLEGDTAYRLLASSMFPWTVTTTEASSWSVNYRLREQLLMQLVHSFGMYSTRPGYISVS